MEKHEAKKIEVQKLRDQIHDLKKVQRGNVASIKAELYDLREEQNVLKSKISKSECFSYVLKGLFESDFSNVIRFFKGFVFSFTEIDSRFDLSCASKETNSPLMNKTTMSLSNLFDMRTSINSTLTPNDNNDNENRIFSV